MHTALAPNADADHDLVLTKACLPFDPDIVQCLPAVVPDPNPPARMQTMPCSVSLLQPFAYSIPAD